MIGFTARFKSVVIRGLALALPFLVGCEGSQQVNIDLPDAVVVDDPFEVTVTHVFDTDFSPISATNASLVFAAIVPDSWDATSAQYEGTADGSPYMVPVSISDAPPESTPEAINILLSILSEALPGDLEGLTCDARVSLREGPLHDDPLIATLFSTGTPTDLAPRDAGPVSLAPYAGGSVYLVTDVSSCFAPNGLLVDNLVVNTGGGNLLSNPSFESGFTDWNTLGSDPECVNEVLGEDDVTAGAGGWLIPLPSDGALLYASDANNPSRCILSQEVSVPGGADATTFTGDVGANILSTTFLFLDHGDIPLEDGQQVIWFRTGDIALFGDITDGDFGDLSVTFVASEDAEEEVEIIFLHGYYAEVPEDDVIIPASASTETPLRRVAPAAGGNAPVQPLATPGFVGLGIWFVEIGPVPFPQSIEAALQVLASLVGAPIPVMSGYMLMGLSVVLALIGVRRRRTGNKRN